MRKLLMAAVLALAGCGGASKKVETGGDTTGIGAAGTGGSDDLKVPKVDESLCDAKGKKVETFDLNHDDAPDIWKLKKEKSERGVTVEIMTCKQVDLDHDGKKDYVVQYDDTGAIILEDYDLDFDGKFDARYHFDKKTGKKYLIERVTAFAGKRGASTPDLWEKYDKDEKLDAVLRDRNGDNKPDYWEQYRAGVLERILYDEDFDGKVDKVDEAKPRS